MWSISFINAIIRLCHLNMISKHKIYLGKVFGCGIWTRVNSSTRTNVDSLDDKLLSVYYFRCYVVVAVANFFHNSL
jgi:hypothetical protein